MAKGQRQHVPKDKMDFPLQTAGAAVAEGNGWKFTISPTLNARSVHVNGLVYSYENGEWLRVSAVNNGNKQAIVLTVVPLREGIKIKISADTPLFYTNAYRSNWAELKEPPPAPESTAAPAPPAADKDEQPKAKQAEAKEFLYVFTAGAVKGDAPGQEATFTLKNSDNLLESLRVDGMIFSYEDSRWLRVLSINSENPEEIKVTAVPLFHGYTVDILENSKMLYTNKELINWGKHDNTKDAEPALELVPADFLEPAKTNAGPVVPPEQPAANTLPQPNPTVIPQFITRKITKEDVEKDPHLVLGDDMEVPNPEYVAPPATNDPAAVKSNDPVVVEPVKAEVKEPENIGALAEKLAESVVADANNSVDVEGQPEQGQPVVFKPANVANRNIEYGTDSAGNKMNPQDAGLNS